MRVHLHQVTPPSAEWNRVPRVRVHMSSLRLAMHSSGWSARTAVCQVWPPSSTLKTPRNLQVTSNLHWAAPIRILGAPVSLFRSAVHRSSPSECLAEAGANCGVVPHSRVSAATPIGACGVWKRSVQLDFLDEEGSDFGFPRQPTGLVRWRRRDLLCGSWKCCCRDLRIAAAASPDSGFPGAPGQGAADRNTAASAAQRSSHRKNGSPASRGLSRNQCGSSGAVSAATSSAGSANATSSRQPPQSASARTRPRARLAKAPARQSRQQVGIGCAGSSASRPANPLCSPRRHIRFGTSVIFSPRPARHSPASFRERSWPESCTNGTVN